MKDFGYRFLIIVLLVLIAWLAIRSCGRKDKELSTRDSIAEIKADSTQYWKDAAGREHASRQVAIGDLASVKAVYRREVDSLKKILKIHEKDIQAFTALSLQSSGTVIPKVDTVIIPGDTSYRLQYDDKWLTLRGQVGRQSFIQYQVRDSIVFTTYSRRVGLFKKETFMDGFSLNPNSHLAGIMSVKIAAPPAKRFGVGPYAGYGWDGQRWKPTVGVSVHYSLIKF